MTISLKEIKNGTEVIFQCGSQKMRGYVLGQDNTLTLIGWKKDEAKIRGYSSWNIKEVAEKALGHRPRFPVPKQYTDAWWLASAAECKIVSAPKQNNLGFLAACIMAGAGLSQASNSTIKKVEISNQTSI